MTPLVATVAFASGVALLLLAMAPARLAGIFSRPRPARSLGDRMRQSLRLAGFLDAVPGMWVAAGLAACVVAALLLGVLAGSALAALAAPAVVGASIHYYLMSRQRAFVARATDELVPFLNRIQTQIAAGRPAQAAYLQAVEESRELKRVLEDSAARIVAGMRFGDALIVTLDRLPLRMWAVFVRQLEAYDRLGGDAARAVEVTVKQVNQMISLKAEAHADYANQARQQRLIVAIALGGIAFFALAVDLEVMRVLWTTVPGYFGMAIGFGLIGGGLWFTRKQLRDIERKLSF